MPTLDLTKIAPGSIAADATETLPLEALEEALTHNTSIAALDLPSDADLAPVLAALDRIGAIYVQFPAFVNGRGFSVARILRRAGFTGQLVASGQLIPDQFAFALQCGFDAVRVSDDELARQTPEAWQAALHEFDVTYQLGYTVATGPATNIFEAREAKRTAGKVAAYRCRVCRTATTSSTLTSFAAITTSK